MHTHQNIWKYVRKQEGYFRFKVVGVVLGLLVLCTALSVSAVQAHAEVRGAGVAAAPLAYLAPAKPDATITSMIYQVFGPYAPGAMRVAMCESSLNPNAINSQPVGYSHAQGLFQILYPATWNTTSQRGNSPYNAWANINAAHEIFVRDGHSWREWVCQP